MWKLQPPWKKVTPLFPSNPPLKVEVLSSPPFLKTWLEDQTPSSPLQKGGRGVPTMTSILKSKAKCVLVVITATGFLMAKGCSKIIIKMHLLELLQFYDVFTFAVNLSNVVNLSHRCRCLVMLKSSQYERYLISICSIESFGVLYF